MIIERTVKGTCRAFCIVNQSSTHKWSRYLSNKSRREVILCRLRQILCQSANAAAKTNSQFKSKYQGLLIRRGHKRAIIAIGHKLLRVIYTVLKNQTPYSDPAVNYEELVIKKNAPRWIRKLKQYGYIEENS